MGAPGSSAAAVKGTPWADGSETFYRRGDALFALPVETSTQFRAEPPRLVFAAPFAWRNVPSSYGVAPGAQRFLAISVVGGRSREVVVAPHWLEELRARYAGCSPS